MKYAITYDYCSEDGYEERDLIEDFEGTWDELQDYLKQMKKQGCYNIYASAVGED